MSYKSPIELYYDINKDMMMNLENEVMNVIYKAGVRVDKDELVRALTYDRKQWEAGYVDGRRAATADAIPVKWIKKQAFEHPQLNRNLFYQMIIEEWEKENEQREDS